MPRLAPRWIAAGVVAAAIAVAVPTLFLFDRQGQSRGAFFGAPPTLHADAERALAEAMK